MLRLRQRLYWPGRTIKHVSVRPTMNIASSKLSIGYPPVTKSFSVVANSMAACKDQFMVTNALRHHICRRSMSTTASFTNNNDSFERIIKSADEDMASVIASDISLKAKRDKLGGIVGELEKALNVLNSSKDKDNAASHYWDLGQRLYDLHLRTGILQALELSICAYEGVSQIIDVSPADACRSRIGLARAMLIRAEISRNASDITQVCNIMNEALTIARDLDKTVRASIRAEATSLAFALGMKTRDPVMLDSVNALMQQAAGSGTQLASYYAARRQRLLTERTVLEGKPFTENKIQQAHQWTSSIKTSTSIPTKIEYLRAVYLVANSTRDATLMEEALAHLDPKLLPSHDLTDLAVCAQALYLQYNLTGKSERLVTAAQLVRQIVQTQLFIHPIWDAIDLEEWYTMLSLPYEVLGDRAYLDELITMLSKAVSMTSEHSTIHVAPVLALTYALNLRGNHTGTLPDRELAVNLIDRCMDKSGASSVQRGLLCLNLTRALRTPYALAPTVMDRLQLAAGFGKQAMDLIPQNHPMRALAVIELAMTLRLQYEQAGEEGDLQAERYMEALRLLTEIHQGRVDYFYSPWLLVNHGILLHHMNEVEEGDQTTQAKALADAASAFFNAIALLPPSSVDRPYALMSLAFTFASPNFLVSDVKRKETQAVKFYEEALRTLPPDHPLVPQCQEQLDHMRMRLS